MKVPIVILLTSFGLMIVGAIVGNYLESSGVLTRERLGPRGVAVVAMFYFALFCVAAFAIVPLVVRAFIAGQIKVGNGELPIIKWLQAHEHIAVYSFWCLFTVGLAIAFALAKDEIFNQLR